jgi:16S rRNA (guanine966-N2)-methyltransferase
MQSMRIIAGEFRGRKLLAPDSDATRPITDRVKQSLFDILTPRLAEARVYDCFAGTGSMGLESLSRGASSAVFFEADRSALTRLRQNVQTLGVMDRTTIIAQDLFRWFKSAAAGDDLADIVFLDPPYRYLRERPQDLLELSARLVEHLKPGGVVVFRHDSADALDLPPLVRTDEREYGGMKLEFLTRA